MIRNTTVARKFLGFIPNRLRYGEEDTWVQWSRETQALKGRPSQGRRCRAAPLGLGRRSQPIPRAALRLPWADIGSPLRGYKTRKNKESRQGRVFNSPVAGLGNQLPHGGGRTADQRRAEPNSPVGQFAYHLEGLVALLRLQTVDTQDDFRDILVSRRQEFRVLFAGRHDRLIPGNRISGLRAQQTFILRDKSTNTTLWPNGSTA